MDRLSRAVCPCPACKRVAETKEEVIEYFGLRRKPTGRLLVQSYCKKCRSLRCKKGAPQCDKTKEERAEERRKAKAEQEK